MTDRVTVLSETLAEDHAIHQDAGRHLDDPDPKDQVQNGAEDRHTCDKPWVTGCRGAGVMHGRLLQRLVTAVHCQYR